MFSSPVKSMGAETHFKYAENIAEDRVRKSLKTQPKLASYVYSNKASRRGLCLIVSVDTFEPLLNLPDRPGSDQDIKRVVQSFSELDFEPFLLKNPSAKSLLSNMRKMSSENFSDCDCFACVILTHGDEGGMIYARDGAVALDQLIQPFMSDKCSDLVGKPKLFFIQACRGTKLDEGITFAETDGPAALQGPLATTSSFKRIPIEADLLVAYAVQPGYYAFRNSVNGSWFIQALSSCLSKFGRSLDMMSILTRVNHQVAYEFESNASTPEYSGKKQMPSIVSTLTKDLFFSPKSQQHAAAKDLASS
ncbi:Caspase-7 [Cichlidogyrus casuarinus]|uniref:Caspase-7 n=1 Tax=Cichlidogyrus casuarinus TaxID=1844966 RepID=A0ABD2PZR7_9PLAT